MSRFIHLLILLLLACAPVTAQTNRHIRRLQSQQQSLKKEIANQEQMLRSTRKDVNAQLANLNVINAQIEGQQKYVDGIHAELTTLSTSIQGLEQQLRLLEADLERCKHKYRHAVNYMFRNRLQLSKWQFILSARNFRQMYRRMRYMTQFSRYQRAQARIIARKEDEVARKRAELLGVKVEKDRLFAEGQAETRKLQGQQTERQQVVDELNKKQTQLQASIAQQRKKAAALDAQIDRLIQQEIAAAAERRRKAEAERRRKAELARQAEIKRQAELKRQHEQAAAAAKREQARKEAERRRAQQQAQTAKRNAQAAEAKGKGKATAAAPKPSRSSKRTTASAEVAETPRTTAMPSFNEADNADRALSSNFAANRGRLPMPITGSYAITTHFGSYNVEGLHGVQLDSKGINITGRPGAQARSIFRGEVTSVFPFGGTYNVIVRHGSYLSVYCNLSSIAVRRGQEVSARQTLGTVATDASGNCTLHFQLRKETSKLNPEAWLGR